MGFWVSLLFSFGVNAFSEPHVRRLYVDMARVAFLYGNHETEFSKKLNFVKPQLIASGGNIAGSFFLT